MGVCVCVNVGVLGSQKRAWDPLELPDMGVGDETLPLQGLYVIYKIRVSSSTDCCKTRRAAQGDLRALPHLVCVAVSLEPGSVLVHARHALCQPRCSLSLRIYFLIYFKFWNFLEIVFVQPIQNDSELKLFFKIICALVLPSSQLCECVRNPEPGVTDCCELPCGHWPLNLGSLEDLLVLLTQAISLAPNLKQF